MVQYEDDGFKLDGYDNLGFEDDKDDNDDAGDYEDVIAGTKRKRAGTEVPRLDTPAPGHSAVRIKAEGSEAFILDEETSYIAHQQISRVPGTFGRSMCSLCMD
jgi:hypothetical protein